MAESLLLQAEKAASAKAASKSCKESTQGMTYSKLKWTEEVRQGGNNELPLGLEFYEEAMQCVNCHIIVIPTISTCPEGHLYCKPCRKQLKKCTMKKSNGVKSCLGKIDEARSAVYEMVFFRSNFACPNESRGCKDVFTGEQIYFDKVLQACPFNKNEPLIPVSNSEKFNASTAKLDIVRIY